MKSPQIRADLIINGDPTEWIKLLALFGFSAKFIAKNTNCTVAIVYHTIYSAKIKLTNYRDGKSNLSKQIVDAIDRLAENDTLKLKLR